MPDPTRNTPPTPRGESASICRPASFAWPRFRLQHVLYTVAVIGASLGLFGPFGWLVAGWVLVTWWFVFAEVEKAKRAAMWQSTKLPVHPANGDKRAEANESGGCDADHARGTPDGSRGFTVLELLVVIAIIGVLIAVLLPAVSRSRPITRGIGRMHSTALATIRPARCSLSNASRPRSPGPRRKT